MDNVLMPSEDNHINYADAQSTTRNTLDSTDRRTGTSNAPVDFLRVQKLDVNQPGQSLDNDADDYCPIPGGFALR